MLNKETDAQNNMRIFSGIRISSEFGSPVIGRLIFNRSNDAISYEGQNYAILSVTGDNNLFDDSSTVGVIYLGDKLCTTKIDYPAVCLLSLPKECDGLIALLDPSDARLYVSPDFKTVEKYAALFEESFLPCPKNSLFKSSHSYVKIYSIIFSKNEMSNNAEGYLADLFMPINNECVEEGFYELYRHIADNAIGLPITVIIDFNELFYYKLRALLRAAVYGCFSVLLRGITSQNELNAAIDRFNKVFCELEAEGREFNGYVKIGLCVDTPCILLQEIVQIERIDFFTFDMERLVALTCGTKKAISDDAIEVIAKSIENFYRSAKGKPFSAAVGAHSLSLKFIELYERCSICEFFCSEKSHMLLLSKLEVKN